MGNQDEGLHDRKPAEGEAEEKSQRKSPRTLNLAELKAAADRARSEPGEQEEIPPVSEEKQAGTEEEKTPEEVAGEPPGVDKPPTKEKPEIESAKEGEKKIDFDPMEPGNPFWKTQLGRSIRQRDAEVEARFAELNATIQLLQADKGKELPKKPSTPEEELEAELEAVEKTEEGKEAKKEGETTAGEELTAKALYTKSYLANNAREEYRNDPFFGEVQALMFNKSDPNHTFNRAWSGVPDADYRINFLNAKSHILEQRAEDSRKKIPNPGEGNLKKETPTSALGIGGDVKTGDKGAAKPIELDEAGKRYVAFMKRKGRDTDKVIRKAFAADLGRGSGAAR